MFFLMFPVLLVELEVLNLHKNEHKNAGSSIVKLSILLHHMPSERKHQANITLRYDKDQGPIGI